MDITILFLLLRFHCIQDFQTALNPFSKKSRSSSRKGINEEEGA
jgi:hypothetical protein